MRCSSPVLRICARPPTRLPVPGAALDGALAGPPASATIQGHRGCGRRCGNGIISVEADDGNDFESGEFEHGSGDT
eukprot:8918707-Alexandrium_andersonii.AAC.1